MSQAWTGREEARQTEAILPRKIMAMKGRPCTGKSTLAWSLAEKHEYCSFVSFQDIRDCLVQVLQSFGYADASETFDVDGLMDDISYEVVCRMASTDIEFGYHVIVDCPLSDRRHLESLLLLSVSTSAKAKLILIECKPKDIYKWQNWLGLQLEWEDLQRLTKGSEYDDSDIPKLIVDTTRHVNILNVHLAVIGLHLSQTAQHVDLYQWVTEGYKPFYMESQNTTTSGQIKGRNQTRMLQFMGHIHQLRYFSKPKDNEAEKICNGCLKSSWSPAYICTAASCKLVLHQLCDGLTSKDKLELPDLLPSILLHPCHNHLLLL